MKSLAGRIRVLDLNELNEPFFREAVKAMTLLLEGLPGSYLHPSKQSEYPWALENAELEPNSRVLDAGTSTEPRSRRRCAAFTAIPAPPSASG